LESNKKKIVIDFLLKYGLEDSILSFNECLEKEIYFLSHMGIWGVDIKEIINITKLKYIISDMHEIRFLSETDTSFLNKIKVKYFYDKSIEIRETVNFDI